MKKLNSVTLTYNPCGQLPDQLSVDYHYVHSMFSNFQTMKIKKFRLNRAYFNIPLTCQQLLIGIVNNILYFWKEILFELVNINYGEIKNIYNLLINLLVYHSVLKIESRQSCLPLYYLPSEYTICSWL